MAYTKYSLTPANNTATPPDGAPEGMLPSAVNDTMRDMMAQIRDCGDGIRDGTYTMTAPKITGGTITGVAFTGNTFTSPVISGGSINNTPIGASTANTGAFTTLSATGVTTVQAGTVSAPALTTTGDTNTGIFFPAADTIAFTEGGVESGRFTSAGALQLNANLTFSGTGNRITGDFSNATHLNRVLLQTSTTNGNTVFGLIPNGTSITSQINLYNNADPTNTSVLQLLTNGTTDVRISSSIVGTGTFVPLTMFTGGSERLRIDTSGNVGIGTSSPSSIGTNITTLDIRGSSGGGLRMGVTSSTHAYQYADSGGYNLFTSAAIPIAFGTNGSERMRITSGGNVGIGTTNPTANLHISKAGGVLIKLGTSLNTSEIEAREGASANILVFSSNNSTDDMVINESGNVGIGTSSPLGRLDVNGTSTVAFVRTTDTTSPTLALFVNGGSNGVGTISVDNGGIMTFDTGSTGAGQAERMRIDSSGNVGIGTSTTSGARLIVSGGNIPSVGGFNLGISTGLTTGRLGTYDSGSLSSISNSTDAQSIELSVGSTAGFYAGISMTGSNATLNSGTLRFATAGSERMRITSGGVLLVGSTSSVSGDNNNKAQVTGSPTSGGVGVLTAYNSASSGGDASPCLTLYKKMTTTSSSARFVQFYANDSAQPMGGIVGNGAENVQFLTLSDEREKTNIQPVSGSLNRIMQIQVSSFNRKGSNEFVPAGFIAQNVLPVYPEYVVENAANDGAEQRYGITGGMSAGYIAELTAALQELKKIVDAQATEIALLKSK